MVLKMRVEAVEAGLIFMMRGDSVNVRSVGNESAFTFPSDVKERRSGELLSLPSVDGSGNNDGGALWQGVGGNLPLAGQGKHACPTLRPDCQDKLVALRGCCHLVPVLASHYSTRHISTRCLHTLEVRPEKSISVMGRQREIILGVTFLPRQSWSQGGKTQGWRI